MIQFEGMAFSYRLFLLIFLVLILFVSVLNAYFLWTENIRWFDEALHLTGGVWVGLAVLGLARRESLLRGVFLALSSAALVGVGWEWFEFGIDQWIGLGLMNLPDTLSDLFFDLFGSLMSSVIFFLWMRKKN